MPRAEQPSLDRGAKGRRLGSWLGLESDDCDGPLDTKACDAVDGVFVAGGIDKAVTKKLTLSTNFQAQRIRIQVSGPGVAGPAAATLPTSAIQGAGLPPTDIRTNRVTLALTGKISVWGNLLVTATGLVTAKSDGLSDRFTPVIGIDYAW